MYAIFEGGGAKGITHIGAMKALEAEGMAIAGVAGSSAGAIIAALAAVGYKADELFSPDGKTNILGHFGKTPVDLLGRWAWRRFRFLRRAFVPLVFVALLAAVAGMVLLHVDVRAAVVVLAVGVLATGSLLLLTVPAIAARALFDNDAIKDVVNLALHEKLNSYLPPGKKMAAGKWVRFRDIDPTNVPKCARLKIIVSDARSGQLVMFDHKTPNVVIADAVAASAAIPFVFRSPEVKGHDLDNQPIFVDGGLVSNLPAWSFRAEKKALEREQGGAPIPIIAFSLNEAAAARPGEAQRPPGKPSIATYLASVIATGIFGSQRVVEDFVSDLVMIMLPSPLKTLDFDCSREQAEAAYQAGLTKARADISRRDRIDHVTTRVLESILAWADLHAGSLDGDEDDRSRRLRVCAIDPIDDQGTAFRITASAGMDQDADDRLELDSRNDLAPLAFSRRSTLCGQIGRRPAQSLMMTKYERALVCGSVESVICIPIVPPSGNSAIPERILCLDSTGSLQPLFNDSAFMSQLQKRSLAASRSLIEEQVGS